MLYQSFDGTLMDSNLCRFHRLYSKRY